MPYERASQEEQNGANFSFVASSSEELYYEFGIIIKKYSKHTHNHIMTESLLL